MTWDGRSGAWTSYSPTWTGSTTNPTLGSHTITAAYMQFGKTVRGRIRIVFGSSNFGSGTYEFGLPVTAAGGFNTNAMIVASCYDSSGPGRASRTGYLQSSTSFRLQSEAGTQLAHNSPWTWAVNDVLVIDFSYEAA